MNRIKLVIITICFKIIMKLMDESMLVEPNPKFEAMVDDLVEGVDIEPLNQVVATSQKDEICKTDDDHVIGFGERTCRICGEYLSDR